MRLGTASMHMAKWTLRLLLGLLLPLFGPWRILFLIWVCRCLNALCCACVQLVDVRSDTMLNWVSLWDWSSTPAVRPRRMGEGKTCGHCAERASATTGTCGMQQCRDRVHTRVSLLSARSARNW
ncbi:uncharacterized protein C8Q71DRAFT_328697 [Rhodofomes roseus]|uniref:Secreted protein n=1 Tax=Rhodofomes roseus TaxID=34475 RepID=A0ABQ8KRQ1_9APHY|nr:uncharacterized protein C8Q71DRAFT_328697 [Rhodofomes roseus]KAH9841417.1 hypothetical protein C8Q71DRAFT_328697 [Rhodofomes roseus]